MRISVIGAGVAGLTAAYEFARAGCEVAIHERASETGPRLLVLRRRDDRALVRGGIFRARDRQISASNR